MRIGILGSGLMGSKLGTIWARAGHKVTFSYSRNEQKLEKLAREAGKNAIAGTRARAVKDADALLLAIHWSRLEDVLKQAGNLSGKVIVSCSIPMNKNDSELVVAHTSSGLEELSKRIPKAHVVGAFNTVPSEVLFAVFKNRSRSKRPSLVYCGDSKGKRTAAKLIRDAGFEPVDAGPLQIASYTEPFTLLVAQLAYEGKGGPELAYRFEHFKS